MKNLNDLKLMELRPAVYNGTEGELIVIFENSSLYKATFNEVNVIGTEMGDTATIYAKAIFPEKFHFVKLFFSGKILDQFIEHFGFEKINRTIKLKVKFIYGTYNTVDDTQNIVQNDLTAYCVTGFGDDEIMDFYQSYHYLRKHPIFNNRFERGLDVEVVKVNPETEEIDDDRTLNTETRIWLETGPYIHDDPMGCEWSHDPYLDCGGKTYEEAIIKLAKLVKERYS